MKRPVFSGLFYLEYISFNYTDFMLDEIILNLGLLEQFWNLPELLC
jgi:hypothetical protein